MGRYTIKPENQLQRLNEMQSEIGIYKKLSRAVLTKKPGEKAWSIIEVVEHMVRSHHDYIEKIDMALNQLDDTPLQDNIKTRRMPSFLIKRFPPKDGKIQFKMKTMKRFQPVFEVNDMTQKEIENVFDSFDRSIVHLNNSVKNYRQKNVKSLIFNSAVGSWVKFNVAEACEFIICHNERHLQQIKNTLKKVDS